MNNILSLCLYLSVIILAPMLYFMANESSKKKLMTILLIFLVLFSGLRWYVGTDFETYISIFNEVSNLDFNDISKYYLDYGATFLVYFSSYLGMGPTGMFMLFSTIIYCLLFLFLKQLDNAFMSSYALFIFLSVYLAPSFNIIRNIISMLCFLNIVLYLLKNRFVNFKHYFLLFLLFCFGLSIHKSLLITIPFLLIMEYVRKKGLLRYFVMGLIFALIVMIIISGYSKFIVSSIFNYIGYYSKYIYEDVVSTYTFLLYLVPPVLPVIYILYQQKVDDEISNKLKLVSLLYLYCIPLQLVGNQISSFDRLSLYPASLQIIFIPMAIYYTKSRSIYIYYTIWFLIYFIVMFFIQDGHQIFPYRIVF